MNSFENATLLYASEGQNARAVPYTIQHILTKKEAAR
jgi:hypothetical protein